MKKIKSVSMIIVMVLIIGTGIFYGTTQEAFATLIPYSETVEGVLVKGVCSNGTCVGGGSTILPSFEVPEAMEVTDGTLRIEAHADLNSEAGGFPGRESLKVVLDNSLSFDEVFRYDGKAFDKGPSITDLTIRMGDLNTMIEDGIIGLVVTAYENVDWPVGPDFTIKATLTYDYVAPEPSPTPEPTTLILLSSGLIGLVGFRKKVKRK